MYMYMFTYMYIYMCTCMCICVFIPVYAHVPVHIVDSNYITRTLHITACSLCTCTLLSLSLLSGLQLQTLQNKPLKAFTYALAPLTDGINPVRKKVLVTEEVQGDHVIAHKLEPTEKLAEIVANYRRNKCSKAVVVMNTSDSLLLEQVHLEGLGSSNFPLLVVSHSDGRELQGILDQDEDVLCDIDVESTVDQPTHQLQPEKELNKAGSKGSAAPQDKGTSGTLYMHVNIHVQCTYMYMYVYNHADVE